MSGLSLDFLNPEMSSQRIERPVEISTPIENIISLRQASLEENDIDDVIAKIDVSNFFFQAKYVLVTYKTWIDKEAIIHWFKETQKAKFVRVAHEIGTKKIDYEHSHVFVEFSKHIQRTNCFCFDWNGIHPNIGPIRFQKHLNRIYRYMCKYDHENDDMLNLIKADWCVTDVWECKTIQEALVNATKANEVSAIIATWNLRPRDAYSPKDWLYPWHVEWHNRVMEKGNFRSIDWIWEDQGNTGKSYWAKEMFKRYPKEVYVLKQMGGAEKCATIIMNAISAGWSGHCLIIDLPRNAEEKSIYEPLESIRDGMVTATRYQGQTMCFDIAWVVVLANFPPNIFSMSKDRWRIHDHNNVNLDNVETKKKIDVCLELVQMMQELCTVSGNFTIMESSKEYKEAYTFLVNEGILDDGDHEEPELSATEAIHALSVRSPSKSNH